MRTWKRCAVLLILANAVAHAAGGHQSDQGITLHGTESNRFERVALHLSSARPPFWLGSFSELELRKGQFVGKATTSAGTLTLQGSDFIGTSFSVELGNRTIIFTLQRADPHTNVYSGDVSFETWQYTVTWQYEGDPVAYNLCPDGGPALAVPGNWLGGTGGPFKYHPNLSLAGNTSQSFSFACMPRETREGTHGGGVSAKCVDWGYPAWSRTDPLPGWGALPGLTDEQARRFHVACVAMAEADYCGEGKPNTLQETPILMYNAWNVNVIPDPETPGRRVIAPGPLGSTGDFYFEAAWSVQEQDGTLRAKALCLTKKRWSTLPLGGTCADSNQLPDPRRGARYCEDYTAQELLEQGALLFSYSKYLDAGLYRFKSSSSDQYITTTEVSIASSREVQAGGDAYRLNLPGVDPSQYRFERFEGIVISPRAPEPVLSNLGEVLRLYRYRAPGGRYVTVTDASYLPSTDYVPDGLEGYVTWTAPSGTSPAMLRQWRMATTGSFVTTTESQPGQHLLYDMGYLPSLAEYATGQLQK